jgi:hypothetical protein
LLPAFSSPQAVDPKTYMFPAPCFAATRGDGADGGLSRSSVSREAVQGSAEQLKSLREKRWETIEILALPSLASLSLT